MLTASTSTVSAHTRFRADPFLKVLPKQRCVARPVPVSNQHDWQFCAAAVVQQQQRPKLQFRRSQQPAWICRSSLASQATPEPIPDGKGGRIHESRVFGCTCVQGWVELQTPVALQLLCTRSDHCVHHTIIA